MQRQLEDKKRIAEEATHKLYNAVRRGDIKAVRSLVSKGANPLVLSPDGRSMINFASSLGHTAIVAELSELANPQDTTNG
jgi:ankyrin repeat protein